MSHNWVANGTGGRVPSAPFTPGDSVGLLRTFPNNVYAQWHLAEGDDGSGQMIEGGEAAFKLLVYLVSG